MKLIQQPPNTSQCGQACIAMLAKRTLDQAIGAIGHDGPTTWEEVYSTLFQFGVVCAPKIRPCFELADLPPVALIILPSGSPVIRHWVVKYGVEVYDPAQPVPQQAADLPFAAAPGNLVLRYVQIKNVRVAKELT